VSKSANSTGRTVLRGFLLLGGVAILGLGVLQGSSFNIGLGALATVLGGFGLWWELTQQSTSNETDG
jgi:hypothetical protein